MRFLLFSKPFLVHISCQESIMRAGQRQKSGTAYSDDRICDFKHHSPLMAQAG
jgi:hypothetical protein